jgi:hypothetical protein
MAFTSNTITLNGFADSYTSPSFKFNVTATPPAITAHKVQQERREAAERMVIEGKLDAFGVDVFRPGAILTCYLSGRKSHAAFIRGRKGRWHGTQGGDFSWDCLVAWLITNDVDPTDVWMATNYTPAFD